MPNSVLLATALGVEYGGSPTSVCFVERNVVFVVIYDELYILVVANYSC